MNKQLTTTICKDHYCPKTLSANFFSKFHPKKLCTRLYFLKKILPNFLRSDRYLSRETIVQSLIV